MFVIGIIGAIVCLIGFVWMVLTTFGKSAVWGLLNIFFQPLAGLIYCLAVGEGWKPFLIMVGGGVLFGLGYAGTIVDLINSILG